MIKASLTKGFVVLLLVVIMAVVYRSEMYGLAATDGQAQAHVSSATGEWVTEWLTASPKMENMSDRSMRLDAGGYPHIAYGEKHLSYVWFNGDLWTYEIVDSKIDVGEYASIALDSNDNAYISYYDKAAGDLRVAFKADAGWQIDTVDSGGDVGQFTSIALTDADVPHVSYYDVTNGVLKHAYLDLGSWMVEVVDNSADVGLYTSLALGSEGAIHIAYYDQSRLDLLVSSSSGSGWSITTVDEIGDVGSYASIGLDSGDYAHVSYYDATNGNLKYAYEDISGWHTVVADNNTDVGSHGSLGLDESGYAHVSYYDATNGNMKYAYEDATGWHDVTVDTPFNSFDIGLFTSLALDEAGRAHISYSDAFSDIEQQWLQHVVNNDGVWHNTVLDKENPYQHFSIAMTSDLLGHPHLSYHDQVDELKYGFRGASGWHFEQFEEWFPVNGSQGGWGSSIAIDEAGNPHISYYALHGGFPTPSNIRLEYATRDATGWHVTTVGSGGDWVLTHTQTSIDLDDLGRPHIAYIDNVFNELKYAHYNGVTWTTETVTTEGFRYNASVALDSAMQPHISFAGPSGEQRYAYRDGLGWHMETIDTSSEFWSSVLALSDEGNPHIGYWDWANYEMKYAFKVGDGWTLQTVDEETGFGEMGFALDANLNPHFAYYGSGNEIKYATIDESGWVVETVDVDGFSFLDLALGITDFPQIAYSSDSTTIKYAYLRTLAVDILPDETQGSTFPSGAVDYQIEVSNLGSVEDSYNVTISGNSWDIQVNSTTIGPLSPGATTVLTVTVTIPPNAEPLESDIATVTVASVQDAMVYDEAMLTTVVSPVHGVEVAPAVVAGSGSPGTNLLYTLHLTNTGSVSDTFAISVSGNAWPVIPSEVSIGPIAPLATQSLTVLVGIPVSTVVGVSDVATITATSQGDAMQSATAMLTTTATSNAIHLPIVLRR